MLKNKNQKWKLCSQALWRVFLVKFKTLLFVQRYVADASHVRLACPKTKSLMCPQMQSDGNVLPPYDLSGEQTTSIPSKIAHAIDSWQLHITEIPLCYCPDDTSMQSLKHLTCSVENIQSIWRPQEPPIHANDASSSGIAHMIAPAMDCEQDHVASPGDRSVPWQAPSSALSIQGASSISNETTHNIASWRSHVRELPYRNYKLVSIRLHSSQVVWMLKHTKQM